MTEKKIRATLGDTAIVGIQMRKGNGGIPSDNYITIRVGEKRGDVDIWLNDGWTVEYIQELPTLPGAIVRGSDGTLYVRHAQRHSEYMWIPLTASDEVWGDDTVSEGGFEVLFEGVA